MIDRKKTIEGLEEAEILLTNALDRSGKMALVGAFKCRNNVADAITLIKEQEAVAPIYEEGEDFLNYFTKHTMGRCGHCKAPLPALEGMRSKFCWMCGRRVKWE